MVSAAVRTKNLVTLNLLGFRAAPALPLESELPGLRSFEEITTRAVALGVLFEWVAAPEDAVPMAALRQYAQAHGLQRGLASEEADILALERDLARAHQATIGWRLENLWPLAWALGFPKTPEVDGAMVDGELVRELVLGFLPGLGTAPADWRAGLQPRGEPEVAELEDLFYCAHNAARSARLGKASVPEWFDPHTGGGVIHERRHALTWCLSRGVAWEAVDLGT